MGGTVIDANTVIDATGIRLGYQIPNFTYPGTPVGRIFGTVAAQAREAEAAGFDTVLVMDHVYQLPLIGAIEEPMLEAYTTLARWPARPHACSWPHWSPATPIAIPRCWPRP